MSQLSVVDEYVFTTGLHTKVKHAAGNTNGNVITADASTDVRVVYCPHCKIRPLVSFTYPGVARDDATTAILAKAAAAVVAPVVRSIRHLAVAASAEVV